VTNVHEYLQGRRLRIAFHRDVRGHEFWRLTWFVAADPRGWRKILMEQILPTLGEAFDRADTVIAMSNGENPR
jgi:hypothetical protein